MKGVLSKILLTAALIVPLALLAWVLLAHPTKKEPISPQQVEPGQAVALPEDAVGLDEYVFVGDGDMYFKYVNSTSSIRIPGADIATLKRVSEYTALADEQVIADCSGAGRYAFYTDKNRVYLAQAWDVPNFRASKIEVIKDMDPATFTLQTPSTATDGIRSILVVHTVGSTTCRYAAQPA